MSNHDLVFSTRTGGALDAANVRREFKAACRAAKIGAHWTPRELRHSFVSLMGGFQPSSQHWPLPPHEGPQVVVLRSDAICAAVKSRWGELLVARLKDHG